MLNEWVDSRGVSPVVGIILMVAITVVLAAIVAVFAMGLGNQTPSMTSAATEITASVSGQYEVQVLDLGNAAKIRVECDGSTDIVSSVGAVAMVSGECEKLTIVGVADSGGEQVIRSPDVSQLDRSSMSFTHSSGPSNASNPSFCSDFLSEAAAGNPHKITTDRELQCIKDDLDGDYVLANNIDASGTASWNGGNGFDPIGVDASGQKFTGTLDGQGYEIRGLTISQSGTNWIGLFGTVSGTSGVTEIQNVHIVNANYAGNEWIGGIAGWIESDAVIKQSSVTGTINGSQYVGGIAGGQGSGTVVDNASVTGEVTATGTWDAGGIVGWTSAGIVRESTAKQVTVTGNEGVGGVVGWNDGTVKTSSASGTISGTNYVGGIAGGNDGSGSGLVKNSTSSATISGEYEIGGVVGANRATVTGSYATGAVSGLQQVGGLVGENYDFINRSTATGDVSGDSQVGGLVGYNRGSILNTRASGAVTGEKSSGVNVGGLVGQNTAAAMPKSYSIKSSIATGDVTASGQNSGGLVGQLYDGSIESSLATGDVISSHDSTGGLVGKLGDADSDTAYINNSVGYGFIDGEANVGGLVGYAISDGEVTGSYTRGNVNGTIYVDPVVGHNSGTTVSNSADLTSSEMTGSSAEGNMPELDFTSVWTTVPNEYPTLAGDIGA